MTGISVFSTKKVSLFFILLFTFSLFISPFILPQSIMTPFLNGPLLWLYGVTGIMLLITGFMLFVSSSLHVVKLNSPDILIAATLIYILIQQLFLSRGAYFTNKLIAYICLTFIYFMVKFYVSLLNYKKMGNFAVVLICIVLGITFISCCYGVLQLFNILPAVNPDFKVTGNFYNPARYANYLIALLPFCISSFFLFPKGSKWYSLIRYVSAIVCLTGIPVLLITNSRAAWLGISVAIGIILYWRYKIHAYSLLRNRWFLGAVPIVITGVGLFLYNLKPESASGRVLIWKISSTIVKQNPVTGIGYGNFEVGYDNYQAQYFSKAPYNEQEVQRADVVRYVYNVFLQVLCEQGLIGLILFLLLIYFVLTRAFSFNETKNGYIEFLTIASASSIISVLVCGQSSYPFDIIPVYIVFFVNMGLLSGIKKDPYRHTGYKISLKLSGLKLFGAFSLCCAGMILYLGGRKFIAYKTLMDMPYYSISLTEMANLFPELKSDIDFINIYSKRLVEEKQEKRAIKVLEDSRSMLMYPELYLTLAQAYVATGQYSKAEVSFKIASNMVPNRFYSKYLRAKFYYETKQLNKALILSENILAMPVKIPSYDVDEIKRKTKLILAGCRKLQNQPK